MTYPITKDQIDAAADREIARLEAALVDAAIDRRMLDRAVPVDAVPPCPVCGEAWCWSVPAPVGSTGHTYCDRHDSTRGPWLVRVESGDVVALASGDEPWLAQAHRMRREAEATLARIRAVLADLDTQRDHSGELSAYAISWADGLDLATSRIAEAMEGVSGE